MSEIIINYCDVCGGENKTCEAYYFGRQNISNVISCAVIKGKISSVCNECAKLLDNLILDYVEGMRLDNER